MNKKKFLLVVVVLMTCQLNFAQKKAKKKDKKHQKETIKESDLIASDRFFFDGESMAIIGNYEEARVFFEKALKLNPKNDAAFYELAKIAQQSKDFLSASKNIQKAIEISPKNPYYLKYKSKLLAYNGEYEEAAKIYNQLAQDNPKKYDYLFEEAYLYILNGDFKKALNIYNSIENEVGIQPDIATQKIKIYEAIGEPNKAEQELINLVFKFPENTEYKVELGSFYLKNKQEEKGIQLMNEILKEYPDNELVLTQLADYYRTIGNDSLSFYYSEKAFASKNIPIDMKIAVLSSYIQFYDQNKKYFSEAYRLSEILRETHPKDAKSYAITGDLYNIEGNQDEALKYFKKSLEYQQDVFTIWQQIFFILSDQKKYQELVEESNRAKEYFPNKAMVYYFNGFAYNQLKDYKNAIKAYERGEKMTGTNNDLKAEFYSSLGNTYQSMKNYKKSDESFDKALELKPNFIEVLNNYSYFLSLRNEKLDKAEKMSSLSNSLSPNNSTFLDTYAWILFQQGNYEKAKEWQEKALNYTSEPSSTLLEHMGDILYKLGEKDAAIKYWKDAAALPNASEKVKKKSNEGEYVD